MAKLLIVIACCLLFPLPASAQTQWFICCDPLLPNASVKFGSRPGPAELWHGAVSEQASRFLIAGEQDHDEFLVAINGVKRQTTNGLDDWSGALYVFQTTEHNNNGTPWANASNAITGWSKIQAGNMGGYAEGIVTVAETSLGSDGLTIAGEFGLVRRDGTETPDHPYWNLKASANLFLGSAGKKASWMIDSLAEPSAGWFNGISLKYVIPGGTAIAIADQTWIKVGHQQTPVLYVDQGRLYLYGDGRFIEVGNLIERLEALEQRRR